MKVSFVIPIYNEMHSIEDLCDEINEVMDKHAIDAEIILVDDGSTDESWKEIEKIVSQQSCVQAIRFRRNFGKAAALSAGSSMATGTILITMDADLQDDPAEIPCFLKAMGKGVDVVSGWKQNRKDPWHKVWPSKVFNRLVSMLTGVVLHDHNCGMKAYRSEVFQEIELYGELHRFVPVLAYARGFRIGEIPIRHRAREHGKSKYGTSRFIKGFLDLLTVKFLTAFGHRPQHFLGTVGLLGVAMGGAGLVYLALCWFNGERPIGTRPLLQYSIAALLLGSQVITIGFLAELIISHQGRQKGRYSVAEQISSNTIHSSDGVQQGKEHNSSDS